MAITIDKILSDKPHRDGSIEVEFILTDGATKRKCRLSGLTDDDTAARAAIVARADELWAIHSSDRWDDTASNIVSSKKTANDKIPTPAQANAAVNVPQLRAIVADLVETVEALKERIE